MITMLSSLASLALLPLLLLATVGVHADSNQTITAIDPRVTYDGDAWTNQDNGGHVFTSVAGSFALDFTGVAVYWFSRRLYNGATVMVMLDDEDPVFADLSAGTTQNDTNAAVVEVLYSKVGLSDSSHHLNMTWDGPGSNSIGTFLENYRILVTSSSSSSGSSASPASSASTNSSSSKSSSNVGAIAGGVVGGVAVGAIIFVTIFLCLRRRKSRATALQEFQSATPFALPRNPHSEMTSTLYSSSSFTKPPIGDSVLLSPEGSGSPGESIPSSRRMFPFAHSWRSRADSANGATATSPTQPLHFSGNSYHGAVEDLPPVYGS